MEKKISFIIPMFNSDKYICNCINSILRQDYDNKEIIVIDDGSNDDSVKICNNVFKEQIKIIETNNFGAPAARNKGISYATGNYVMFIDSDDFLMDDPTIISGMISKMEIENSKIVFGKMNLVDECGNVLKDKKICFNEIKDKKMFNMLIDPLPSNKIYDLDFIKEKGIYFDNVRIGQDLNFYLKYIAFCDNVAFYNEYVSNYRIVSNSISRTYTIKILDIVNSLNYVDRFYKNNNIYNDNHKYINVVRMQHLYSQLSKNIYFKSFITRAFIKNYLTNEIRKEKINYAEYDKSTVTFIRKIRIKIHIKKLNIYRFYKLIEEKKNGK